MKISSSAVQFLICFAIASACTIGKKGSDENHPLIPNSNSETSSSLSYQYNVNGCDTGKQEFSSQKSLCDGLLDESRNSGCAQGDRYKAYQNSCSQYGSIQDRTGNVVHGDDSIATSTPCGNETCSPREFCLMSRARRDEETDLVPPKCITRKSEVFTCDDAAVVARAQFPTSNNCSRVTECSQSGGQFMFICYLY